MRPTQVQLRIRRRRRKLALFVPFIVVVVGAATFFPLRLSRDKKTASASAETQASEPPAPAQPPLREDRETVRPGATIGTILASHGFSPAEVQALYDQTRPVFDLRRLKAGQQMRLFSDARVVLRVEYDVDDFNYLSISRGAGGFAAEILSRPVDTETSMIWGSLEESPIVAFDKLGEEDVLALAFADLFGWDIDFYIDLRPGDSFKVIFEKKYLQGKFVGYGNILAAEITNQGKTHQAFYYTPPGTGKHGYYDAEGKSLEKEFRKSPIKWARITSRFTHRRLHPIHQVYRAHYGVDYAADIGTPVQATADGTVIFAGWNGGSGRMVRIRHKNAYETMYLHLRSFAPAIKSGAKVKGGDIIGYVGSSGDTTGPHLDYRIKLKGSYLNPLSAKFAPVEPLKEEILAGYGEAIRGYRMLLEDPLVLALPSLF